MTWKRNYHNSSVASWNSERKHLIRKKENINTLGNNKDKMETNRPVSADSQNANERDLTPAQVSRERAEEKNPDYEIESIKGHRIIMEDLQLLLKYKGYNDNFNTYESIGGLGNLKELVKDYLQSVGLSYNENMFLADSNETSNDESEKQEGNRNFCYDVEVLLYIQQYRKQLKLTDGIKIDQFPGKEETDKNNQNVIYLLSLKQHFYVLYYLNTHLRYYVADGANHCKEETVLKDLRKVTGKDLKPLEYEGQTGIDYCGSSAVLIALYFIRQYQTNRLPDNKVMQKAPRLRSILEKRMHRGSYISLHGRRNIVENLKRTEIRCPKCNRKFKKISGLRTHEKTCNK